MDVPCLAPVTAALQGLKDHITSCCIIQVYLIIQQHSALTAAVLIPTVADSTSTCVMTGARNACVR